MRNKNTFAVGHLALGYLTGKAASKLLDVKINVAFLFLASILPDADLLLGLDHRGPTHSLLVYAVMFVPVFWAYGKQAVPFFVALAQHSLLGDLLTGGGVQVLWPAFSEWYGAQLKVTSFFNISLEWVVFLMAMAFFLKTRDAWSLYERHPFNLLLTIPVVTIILPAFLSFPIAVPSALVVPHLVLLAILFLSIAVDLKKISKSKFSKLRLTH